MLVRGLAPLMWSFPPAPTAGRVCSQHPYVGVAMGEGTGGAACPQKPGQAGAGYEAQPSGRKTFAGRHLAIESLLLEARGHLGFDGFVHGPP